MLSRLFSSIDRLRNRYRLPERLQCDYITLVLSIHAISNAQARINMRSIYLQRR